MAIIIECNYAKKLGLPGYSSHQYSVTIRSEISDIGNLAKANEELYRALQDAVDSQIENAGYVPDGKKPARQLTNGSNGSHQNGSGSGNGAWTCSDKQKELILKLVEEYNLNKAEIDALSLERFGKRVKELNKPEASALIEELLVCGAERHPPEESSMNGAANIYTEAGAR